MSKPFYEFSEQQVWDFARGSGIQTKQSGDELIFSRCPYCGGGKRPDKGTFSINLRTGLFSCKRSSCSVSGNVLTLAKDFEWFSLGRDYDAYFKTGQQKHFRSFKKMVPIKPKPAAISYLESRGISAVTAEKYQITVHKEHENVLVFPFLDEKGQMQYIKYRKTDFNPEKDKNKEWCESNCKPILFGMSQCNPENKTLVLTEGQIDSLSVAEAGIENAVSVPSGKNGFTWIPYCWDWLQQFETLIVFGDCERGEITLLDEMRKRFNGVLKVVRAEDYRGLKDANALLLKHGKQAVRHAVENATIVPVKQVVDLADVQSVDLLTLPKIPTGIASLDKVLSGGLFYGQTIILTGKRGDGKSTLGSQIVANALNDGKKAFCYSGELMNYHFKNWIDRQIAGEHNCIDRIGSGGIVSYFVPNSKLSKINEWYRGRCFLYDNNATEDDELEDLLSIIEKTVQQFGIDLVLLDNLMTALDVSMSADLYRAQSQFVHKLVKLTKRLGVVTILVAHPRKNSSGDDDNNEISGSADIVNRVDVCLTYKRKKQETAGDPERVLTVSKNRLTGRLATGDDAIPLYYDCASKRISDTRNDFKKQFGWEIDEGGFSPVTEQQAAQLEIPFDFDDDLTFD